MITKLIRNFCSALKNENHSIPIAIEVDEKTAQEIKNELPAMLRYGTVTNLPNNTCLFNGVLIVAPKNFIFK